MELQKQHEPNELSVATNPEKQKGAIGIALLVWLFGGGLGVAVLVFVLLKAC
ncbi:MAG: hypothetical protein AB7T06_12370 [Kofleriaceae bacterium]